MATWLTKTMKRSKAPNSLPSFDEKTKVSDSELSFDSSQPPNTRVPLVYQQVGLKNSVKGIWVNQKEEYVK